MKNSKDFFFLFSFSISSFHILFYSFQVNNTQQQQQESIPKQKNNIIVWFFLLSFAIRLCSLISNGNACPLSLSTLSFSGIKTPSIIVVYAATSQHVSDHHTLFEFYNLIGLFCIILKLFRLHSYSPSREAIERERDWITTRARVGNQRSSSRRPSDERLVNNFCRHKSFVADFFGLFVSIASASI